MFHLWLNPLRLLSYPCSIRVPSVAKVPRSRSPASSSRSPASSPDRATTVTELSDIAKAVRELSKAGVKFMRYNGLEQDADGVWLAPRQITFESSSSTDWRAENVS